MRFLVVVVLLLSAVGCNEPVVILEQPAVTVEVPATSEEAPTPFNVARKGFQSRLTRQIKSTEPLLSPPEGVLDLIRYPSSIGDLAAYVTPDPGDGKKHPAIIWIHGGSCQEIGDLSWTPGPVENDQSANQFVQAGLVTMFPSMRGGTGNPGVQETYVGEVDDVIAAAEYLAKLPFVDPQRIYLGGHSTGGTLALLVAEASDRFRAVFAFGPAAIIGSYGDDFVPCDPTDRQEMMLRSPALWLPSIKTPTFIIEGEEGNIDSLRFMQKNCTNPLVKFVEGPKLNHFNILAPTNRLIAEKILGNSARSSEMTLTSEEIVNAF